ncbi:serine hydrolase [Erythrobacter sp.]|jgi:beta-lactamase class A|uniref:serine hydrolase n=1 Tax=Erythrobacter sp. TaxID=1042 RepID=UPI002ECB498F|nr:serine hydrolase [Erythrobacter sp.]
MSIPARFLWLILPLLAFAIALPFLVRPERGEPASRVMLAMEERIETPEERAFEQRLEEIGAGLDGEVGIAVVDAETGYAYDFDGHEMLPQQSVSKLWVSMVALAQVDAGELDLDEGVTIRREDLVLFHQPIREIVRTRGSFTSDYADLLQRAITRSDNAANDRLLRRVGGAEEVQDWLDDNDIEGVRFGLDERTKQSAIAGLEWRQSYSYGNEFYQARDQVPEDVRRDAFESYLADPVDGATPLAIARALARLANGELLSPASTQALRDTLEATRSGPRRLKGGAPEGWRVEHKTGTGQFFDGEQSGYNDVGILTSPEGRDYAVAVMIGRTREPTPARMEMMQAVTAAVAEFDRARRDESEPQLAAARGSEPS